MSVLFLAKVYKGWQDERDSSNRVAPKDHSGTAPFRVFALNPKFITDLKACTTPAGATGSTFRYSDNIGDRREKWSTIICDKTVAEIEAYIDTTPSSYAITLPIYPNNNPARTPVDTTILWETISYADRYNPDSENHCWVIYDRGSFRRVEVLTDLAIEDVVDLVRGGSTSTTYSTVEEYF